MIFSRKVIGIALIIASFLACKKEGCTDCNAMNYNASVEGDNMSCEYAFEDRVATYAVSDSITDPFQTVFFRTYEIEIRRIECNPAELLIYNYGNIKNSKDEPIAVVCKISDTTISIANQIIEGPDANATTDYLEIFQSSGYFSNDSIFIELLYSDRFDPYLGSCWGKKN